MIVAEVELNPTKRKLMTKVLLTSALYAQLAHSKASANTGFCRTIHPISSTPPTRK